MEPPVGITQVAERRAFYPCGGAMWIKCSCPEPRHHQRDKALWGLYHERRGWSASTLGGGRASRAMPSGSLPPVTARGQSQVGQVSGTREVPGAADTPCPLWGAGGP